MAAFLICWTPYAIVYLWPVINNAKIAYFGLTAIAPLMAKLSTIATPMILIFVADEAPSVKKD